MLVMTMKRLQMNLKYLGYYNDKIDGMKGNNTKSAIRRFRNDNGLGDSDIADQKMIDCIRNIICEEQRKIGATVDGVAGDETYTKKAEFKNSQKVECSWDNIRYFKQNEFTCKCGCGLNRIDLRLVKILDEIREHFGRPVIVTSGCRCVKHNAKEGGVQGSRHVLGKAADFYIQGVSISDTLNYTRNLVAQGKLRYTYTGSYSKGYMGGAVHIDIV